jgi:hypothetical protein
MCLFSWWYLSYGQRIVQGCSTDLHAHVLQVHLLRVMLAVVKSGGKSSDSVCSRLFYSLLRYAFRVCVHLMIHSPALIMLIHSPALIMLIHSPALIMLIRSPVLIMGCEVDDVIYKRQHVCICICQQWCSSRWYVQRDACVCTYDPTRTT